VWRRLFEWTTGGKPFTRLLTAMQGEVPRWDQPLGQNGEGLTTRSAYPSSHPYSFLLLIVSLAQAQSVADDRIVAANGASPRQALQRNYPGSSLSFVSGSAITRITAGVKARLRPSPAKFRSAGRAFTLPAKSVSDEKRILLSGDDGYALTWNISRLFSATRTELAQ
jgi:hypothetical protein